ncbi:MAG: bifunctional riboflavin kinase/FAD synthetase [Clostridia bacterium]|nr:bifunctional riboflavin kinase/FAD synthetase [Clostridia bacterium]
MQTYISCENIPSCPRSVALGLFDGLHPAHRQVILAAADGIEDGTAVTVYTFDPATVTTKAIRGLLCDQAEEEHILRLLGADELFRVDFAAVQHLSPEEFVHKILKEQLGAVKVSCGYNYRFGYRGAGDTALLTALCAEEGISVTVVPEIDIDGIPVSSTAIRAAIADGDMALARRLLGRPYCLRAPVVAGQHLGSKLAFPTINQVFPNGFALPRFGVYASRVEIEGETYPAVTNIGLRPTVGADAPLAETHIFGFSGDLYGKTPSVYPLTFLRPEQRFDTIEELQAQIRQDAAAATLIDEQAAQGIRAVFFDFDDTLDNRDHAFRAGLSAFLRYYYPSLSEEEVISRREEMFYFQRGHYGEIIYYRDMLAHFLEVWPPEVPTDVSTAYRRMIRAFAQAGQPHPDVYDTLTALRQRGYLVGIITNGTPGTQCKKIDCCNLRLYADLVVLAGDEGIQKPDPRIFRIAAARLGVSPSACLFVGDHPINDLEGARAAGFRPVRKEGDWDAAHPIHSIPVAEDIPTIRRISEVLTLLDDSPT